MLAFVGAVVVSPARVQASIQRQAAFGPYGCADGQDTESTQDQPSHAFSEVEVKCWVGTRGATHLPDGPAPRKRTKRVSIRGEPSMSDESAEEFDPARTKTRQELRPRSTLRDRTSCCCRSSHRAARPAWAPGKARRAPPRRTHAGHLQRAHAASASSGVRNSQPRLRAIQPPRARRRRPSAISALDAS